MSIYTCAFAVTITALTFPLLSPNALTADEHLQFTLLEQILPQNLWPTSFHTDLAKATRSKEDALEAALANGEEHFCATLYAEAIPYYLELQEPFSKSLYPKSLGSPTEADIFLFNRLGKAYFFTAQHSKAIKQLSKIIHPIPHLSAHLKDLLLESLLFLAQSYRHTGQHPMAISTIKQYLQSLKPQNEELRSLAIFELAVNHLLEKKIQAATRLFASIKTTAHSDSIVILDRSGRAEYNYSQLYLAQIALQDRVYEKAKRILTSLKELTTDVHILHEIEYFLGVVAFDTNNFEDAIAHFELSIAHSRQGQLPRHPLALKLLAKSHLQIAKNSALHIKSLLGHLNGATTAYELLLKFNPSERVYLQLAKCLLLQKCTLNAPSATLQKESHLHEELPLADRRMQAEAIWHRASTLLTDNTHFTTVHGRAHALLLQAENAPSYQDRELLFTKLEDPQFKDTTAYAKGLFAKGIHRFKHAELQLADNAEEAYKSYAMAAKSFANAVEALNLSNLHLSSKALHLQILSYQKEGSVKMLHKAWMALSNIVEKKPELIAAYTQPEELHFQLASIAAQIGVRTNSDEYSQKAAHLFWNNFVSDTKSPFAHLNLHSLACLYMNLGKYVDADSIYNRILTEYPDTDSKPAALYFAAECAEKLKKPEDIAKSYRKELFENHPSSPFAPMAYFHFYGQREYIQGDQQAFIHLDEMDQKFSNTPLLINAYLLLGLDFKRDRTLSESSTVKRKDDFIALNYFIKATQSFETLMAANSIPESERSYYFQLRYRALLEEAEIHKILGLDSHGSEKITHFQRADDIYNKIHGEFQHYLTPSVTTSLTPSFSHSFEQLKSSDVFSLIHEESIYAKLKLYLSLTPEAMQPALDKALAMFNAIGAVKGYHLSKTYYDLGLFNMKQGDTELAGQAFMRAEECDKGKYLSTDDRLDLWIQQSLCYRQLGMLDKAMLVLSRVINHHAVSSLRIQAMYLRAEIYTVQGRHDLARKQLEATAKKGGEWALKAKDRLELL